MPFDILVKKDATVDDTLRLIVNAVNVCSSSPFVNTLVVALNPSDKNGFPQRLFDYVCRNATYRLDNPGTEEVWTPEKTIREKFFDCKKVSVLLGSVLKAAGFDPVLKHVYYAGADGSLKDYTHIYVILPNPDFRNYITLDPTNDCQYNREVDSNKQTLYFLNGEKMDLHMMGKAVGQNEQAPAPQSASFNTNLFQSATNNAACKIEDEMRSICGMPANASGTMGLNNGYFNYTVGEAAIHGLAIIPMGIPRAAFLGLLYLGKLLANTSLKLNWSARLASAWQKDAAHVRKTWWTIGGDSSASNLKYAIIKGSGVTISGPVQYDYDRPLDVITLWKNEMHAQGIGFVVSASVIAAITAATPVVLKLLGMLKEMGIVTEGQTDPPVPDNTPIPDPPSAGLPAAGSFATHSIDTWHDAGNFVKAAGVMMLGASLHPALILPTVIIVGISFLYAIRKKLFLV